ncbi:hypothetical protein [Halorubellus sp. PRR65]|uniref:hypothetical protein n=1 Tax=Halorubellus sp. PRR65 TaxID=3098148 RepID=UPI002B26177B|nr:hypothetical protein [Halorubellus sp. PRR65]
MKRREFVAGAVSVTCAGVVGASHAGEFASATTSRPDRLDGVGSSASDAPESDEAASGEGDLAEPSTLEVVSTTSGSTPVRYRLVRDDGTVAHDDVREMTYGERAHLSGLCERGETYVFTLAVDGAVLVRETVAPGERAVFELLDETTVSVVA